MLYKPTVSCCYIEREKGKIGILGGTFDPIHHGHLIVAEVVREESGLDKILFIPSGMPPHKDLSGVTCGEHRFNMVKEAINNNPLFEASRIEIEREGLTYTIDTLKRLKNMYGDDTGLFFIIGADVVGDILTWKDFEKVFSICEFIAVLRPEYKEDDFEKNIEFLRSRYMAKIHIVNIPLIEISSTIIRGKVQNGKSIKYMVPDRVETYIKNNGLYSLKRGCL